MNQHLGKCEFENVTVANHLYQKIAPRCSNMRWIIGPKECSNVTVPKGILIQNLFNDTYWNDDGRKALIQNKILKVGTVIVNPFLIFMKALKYKKTAHFLQSPPFMTKTMINGHSEYGGIAHELLTTVSRHVGFKYTKKCIIFETVMFNI